MTIFTALSVAMLGAAVPVHAGDMTLSAPGATQAEACSTARQRIQSRYEDRYTRVTRMSPCDCSPRRNSAGRVYGYVCEIKFTYERRE
ncbi:hypothetical protein GCM10009116_13350 [Brevundimonas basaltis]